MDLSIIIPAFEESLKIENDIILADRFIEENNLKGEIIVVDDGSRDDTFDAAMNSRGKLKSNLIVLKNGKNLGKGGAVKRGILSSKGDLVLYQDAGATVPMHNALAGMELITKGRSDMAIGSRKLPDSKILKKQEPDRALISKIFKFLMKIFFRELSVFTDTQCGYKIYNGKIAREIYSELETSGFIFEIEILLRALRKNYRVVEFPVEWSCDRDSRITLLKSPWKVISELNLIRKMNL